MDVQTDINTGLSSKQVEKRIKEGLYNEPVKNQSKTVGQIIAGNLFTYFNLIFFIFTLLLALVHSYINMTFLPIIIINMFIGIIQEIRTKRVLDKLTLLNASYSTVIRDGKEKKVLSEELVLGDLCILGAGKQISADAVVVEGSIRVNEALVTGEADEITKEIGDKLLSGSFVVAGECRAVLEHVGLDSYASKIALEAKASRKKQKTEMMNSLDKLVKTIGIAIIPIGILMFCQTYFLLHSNIQQSVVAIIAALVGMIPEGLYLLTSVALVVSVMRLGKKNVLVHEMACVETLARVNVLCVDKTGTITENKMTVNEVVPIGINLSKEIVVDKIGNLVSVLDNDNNTMNTLKEYFTKSTGLKAIKTFGFSSETKFSSAQMENGDNYVIGAPERVLLTDYCNYQKQIEEYARRGMRVLIFGVYDGQLDGHPLEKPVVPMAIVVIGNAIRKEARETFEYFANQGVEIKVISGDNPLTVSCVAKEAGIAHSDMFVDASSLETDEQIEEAAQRYTIFGRVQPDQKKRLVQALKKAGNVVAMTGDGVNDVLALKSADCSIAFGSGSEAASNVAQLVLLDSDFSCMPSVVLEGRRVVNNIQRTASLFVVKNIFSILLALFSMLSGNRYPLYPTQLSLLGAFTIGAPGFLLALQPSKSLIKGGFLRNVIMKALPAAITDFLLVAIFVVIGNITKTAHEQLSTIVILILLAVGMCELIRVCMPMDRIRIAVCIMMTVGIVFSVLFLKEIFAIYPLTINQMIQTACWMIGAVPIFIVMCKLVDKFFTRNSK